MKEIKNIFHVHLLDPGAQMIETNIHGVLVQEIDLSDALFFAPPLCNALCHGRYPFSDKGALGLDIALVADRSMSWNNVVYIKGVQEF